MSQQEKKERPNIEIDSKKVFIYGTIILTIIVGIAVFFWIGGSSKAEVNPITQTAKNALSQNQKYKALEILAKGNKDSTLDTEGTELLVQLQNELYPYYLAEGQKAEQEENYASALNNYKKSLAAVPEGIDTAELEENINRTETIVKEQERLQKEFSTYVVTFEKTLKESNTLLTDFKAQLDGVEIGKITTDSMVSTVKNKISKSREIISGLDNALFIQDQNLLEQHKTLIAHVNFQHDMFLASLELNKTNKAELVPALKDDYLKIKQEQVTLIQGVTDFAEQNNLNFDLKIEEK